MDWAVLAGGAAVGAGGGLVAGLLLARARVRQLASAAASGGSGPLTSRRPSIVANETVAATPDRTIADALARKSIDSLRVGVVVLDADDVPVLINPAARAMGMLRAGATPGSIAAHPIIRTLAGQVRRTGIRREVELDLPRGTQGGAQDPLGVHLRAVGLSGNHVAIEAADVTESHRVARVRRDFVANVSHELKTPIGALQLLAEALLDATDPDSAVADPSEDAIAGQFQAGLIISLSLIHI